MLIFIYGPLPTTFTLRPLHTFHVMNEPKLSYFSPTSCIIVKRKKNWRNLNLAMAPHCVLHHHKHFVHVDQAVLPSSCSRYLNKVMSTQIYTKYNWQHASTALAICTDDVGGSQAGPRAILHAFSSLRASGQK